SDACIIADFKDMGIIYDPYKKKRWEHSMFSSESNLVYRYEPPEYIPSQTLNMLEEFARKFLADLDRLREHSKEIEYNEIIQQGQTQERQEDHEELGDDLRVLFGL